MEGFVESRLGKGTSMPGSSYPNRPIFCCLIFLGRPLSS